VSTLITPDEGEIAVFGVDALAHPKVVQRMMNRVSVEASFFKKLSAYENLLYGSKLYGVPTSEAKPRIGEILTGIGFDLKRANEPMENLSRGMQQKIALARALLTSPMLLLLDEPTTGLDPRSRSELWEVLRELVADGTTLLLTTQYLEEADQLADRIVVMDHGRIIADGTPLELKDQSGKASLVVTVSHAEQLEAARALLATHAREVHVDVAARQLTAPAEGLADMTRIAGVFDGSEIVLDDLGLKRPTLDDVFLHLIGRRAEESIEDDDPVHATTQPTGEAR
jgi:ABC-2 type transport system ATP-binding protein